MRPCTNSPKDQDSAQAVNSVGRVAAEESAMCNEWDRKTLQTRIRDTGSRVLYEAGSPNAEEIAAYAAGLLQHPPGSTAIVLGMTPELRSLATSIFEHVISIDRNLAAIELYADWLPSGNRQRETIVHDDWFHISDYVSAPASAVLGDGVFGNLPDVATHRRLLTCIATALSPGGRFVTRKAMVPRDFRAEENSADRLLHRFREGEIDESEFGFGVRLLGHYRCCYDPARFLLDNKKLFDECDRDFRTGKITQEELSFIRRYYFSGTNCIVPQALWERILAECHYDYVTHPCHGKTWYDYYKVYACTPHPKP